MKAVVPMLALMLTCMTGIQCRTVLELKDTKDLHIEVTRRDDHTHVEISGFAFSSALVAEGIRTQVEESDLIIKVMLVPVMRLPADHGLSGTFHYSVRVPGRIERVLFGDGRQEIRSQDPPSSSEPTP
jgi:hypothetical protein